MLYTQGVALGCGDIGLSARIICVLTHPPMEDIGLSARIVRDHLRINTLFIAALSSPVNPMP